MNLTEKQVRIAKDIFRDYEARCEAVCTCWQCFPKGGDSRPELTHYADCEQHLWLDEKWTEAKAIALESS